MILKNDIMSFKRWQKLLNSSMLYSNKQNNRFLVLKYPNLTFKIKRNGYIPRSGLLLARALNEINIKRRAVLDIGTGETGFLAYYALAKGANIVVACDIDKRAIAHAKIASENGKNIIWKVSDVFSNIPNIAFDFIVSNPPQMPMPNLGNFHDYGGSNGRDVILRIIKNSHNYLGDNGSIILLCFDFLGVIQRFSSEPSIKEIANNYGLRCAVIAKYKQRVRRGGKTEENLNWIKKVYPLYQFKKTPTGDYAYKIFILELKYAK